MTNCHLSTLVEICINLRYNNVENVKNIFYRRYVMFRKTLSVLLAVLLLCAAVPMGAVQAAAAEGSLSAD